MTTDTKITEISINGEVYVRKSEISQLQLARDTSGLQLVIVSCGSNGGGIHFGFAKHRDSETITLVGARRVQYWSGAASISEMATRGVSKPNDCRFAPIVPEITLRWVEVIPVSERAGENLFSVPVWTK